MDRGGWAAGESASVSAYVRALSDTLVCVFASTCVCVGARLQDAVATCPQKPELLTEAKVHA